MAMDPTAGAPRFTVGGVISAAFSVVFANLFRFLAVILAVVLPVGLLLIALSMVLAASLGGAIGPAVELDVQGTPQILLFLVFGFIALTAYFLIQAALTAGTLQALRGQRAAIGACLASGLAALPRVLLACLILFVAVGLVGVVVATFGNLIAAATGVVGGVLLAVAYTAGFLAVLVLIWVFVPAIVVERAGPLQCFSRSMALTKGRRWQILAILVLIGAANWLIALANQALTQIAPVAGPVIDIASALFFLALGPVLSAVGYYYLRAEKEGVAIDDVVRVFD